MAQRVVERFLPLARTPLVHARLPKQSPRIGEPTLLVCLLEQADRALGLLDQAGGGHIGLGDEPHVRTPQAREPFDAALARRQRPLQRLLVDLAGLRVVRGALERLADCRQQLQPPARRRGEKRSGSLQQSHRRGVLPRACGAAPGGGKPAGRALAERERALVHEAEVGAVPVRPLEVMAEDRLDLDHAFGMALLQPVREPLVQLRAILLGD
jgi:hypothetical protein